VSSRAESSAFFLKSPNRLLGSCPNLRKPLVRHPSSAASLPHTPRAKEKKERKRPVKKFSLALLALATALAISPAALADSYNFSFNTPSYSFYGYGTFTTDSAGTTITSITGTLDSDPGANIDAMTLLDPGAFASNDNTFNDAAPYVDQSGLSFSVDKSGTVVDYNIFWYGTASGYGVTGACGLEGDCITDQANGIPSEPVSFNVTNVTPEPSSLLFLGTGLFGLAVILFRKQKASGHSSIS
jgi:hypothetical protein